MKSFDKLTQAEKDEIAKKVIKQKAKEQRYWTKQKLILRKAAVAGIKVTEAEIDAELKLGK